MIAAHFGRALTRGLLRLIVTYMAATLPSLHKLPSLSEKLLAKFIADKLNTYVEPTKEGTPKGEPVGFSSTKYKATLYRLRERVLDTSEDLTAQAKELKVSYGLLRKWRSEQDFKDLVSQHEKEFVNYLMSDTGYRTHLTQEQERAKMMVSQIRQYTEVLRGAAQAKQKESLRKLMILVHGNWRDDLMKSNVTANEIRKYQQFALDQAIELLQDRRAATKHRQDIVKLLTGVRETLK
jgi:hypothetical protein